MSQYPGAGYGQPFTAGHGSAPAEPARPATLGIVGLALVAIDLVIVVIAKVFSLGIAVSLVHSTSGSTDQLGGGAFGASGVGFLLLMMVSGAIGLAGWVIGIVATVTNRGRAFGIAAIVVGAVSWVIAGTMMFGILLVSMG